MTALAAAPIEAIERAWIHRVRAVVREEFTEEVLTFAASDLRVSAGQCRVAGCDRLVQGYPMCAGHHQRWSDAGRPDIEEFAAVTPPVSIEASSGSAAFLDAATVRPGTGCARNMRNGGTGRGARS